MFGSLVVLLPGAFEVGGQRGFTLPFSCFQQATRAAQMLVGNEPISGSKPRGVGAVLLL